MRLHSERYGAGPPLLILHGLFGSLENWRSLSKAFGQAFTVFALDQRNHGRSPQSAEFTYPAMAEDLREFLADHALPAASLLGHSMGGKTAMQFATTYPELVDKLVVVDIAPRAYPPEHHHILAALSALDLKTLRSRQDADTRLAGAIPDVALRQFLLKNLVRDAAGTFRWRINLDGLRGGYAEILKAVLPHRPFEKPTLFVRGGNSAYIRTEDTALITSLFPHAHIVTIPHAGHWVHADAPQEFVRIVQEFLA